MNHDESISKKYLESNYSNVIYEPDGNIPPDFSVDSTIGVEVRRLNQQHRDNGTAKGLEEGRIPLVKAINSELSNHSKQPNGNSYWLRLQYERNIGKIKDIKKNIKAAITAFESQNEVIPFSFKLSDNVLIEFVLKVEDIDKKYKIAIESDQNSGGWVVSMYAQDTMHCINEKERKISPYINNYKSWWLLLVDSINCMDDYDKNDIISHLIKPACFERVIIISTDGEIKFEI